MSINLNAVNVNYEYNFYCHDVNNVKNINFFEKSSAKEKHLNAVENHEQKNFQDI